MTTRDSLWLGRGIWAALFAAASFVLLGVGWSFYHHRAAEIEAEKSLNLNAITQLKCDQIQRWRQERLAAVTGLARNRSRAGTVAAFLRETNSAALRAELRDGLTVWTDAYAGAEMLLVSLDGSVLVSTGDSLEPLSAATLQAIQSARTNAVLSDFFADSAGAVRIDAAATMRDAEGKPMVIILFRSRATDYLFPLIQSWPVPSKSAETMIVQRDGDHVLFLNELRHGKATALNYREPLSRTNQPAVQAVLGFTGRFNGTDYRGVKVLADLKRIPGSPWFLVTKIDEDEILAQAREQAFTVGTVVIACIMLAGFATAYGYRRQQARLYARLYKVQLRELEAHQAFRTTLYSIGDAVITTGTDGRVREMNRVAEQLTGWTEAEGHQRSLDEVFPIIDESTRQRITSPVDLVLREKRIVALANHTLLISRDGTERPISDSAAPIRARDGSITGVVLVFSDQTLQRTARRALEEREERLRMALTAASQGLYDLNIQTGEGIVNPEYARILGYDPETFRETADSWRDRLHPEDREQAYNTFLDYVAGRRTEHRIEYRQMTASGGWKWILSIGKLVPRSGNGGALRVLGTVTDITERKETHRALMESEERLRQIFEHSAQLFYSHRPDNVLTYVSPRSRDFFDCEPADAMLLWTSFLTDNPVNSFGLKLTRLAIETGKRQPNYQLELKSRLGRKLWVEVCESPVVENGKTVAVVGALTDITETKRTQDLLRLQNSALEAAANAIVITDRTGTIQWVNAAFTQITGYSAGEAVGKNLRILKSGKHNSVFYGNLWTTIHSGTVWHGELMNRRKDGTEYMEEMTVTPVQNESNEVTHFIAVKQDISQRKALEEQFRQAQKMEAFGQLAGGVAHDFNNILAVIMMQAGLLQADNSNDAEASHIAREIGQAAQRGADLTRQLLLFSRRQALHTVPLNLNVVVANIVRMLKRIVGEHIDVKIKPSEAPLWINGDAGMVDQVLVNLVVNARDAMPRGGQLLIEITPVELDEFAAGQLPHARPGAFVCLAVKDTGCGIAPENLNRIFEPFFTTKDVGKGTGLGLATVFGIVQQHNGWIEVRSEVGRGTMFRVYFPRVFQNDEAAASSYQPPDVCSGEGTILLVEDETPLRLLMRNCLARLGYQVIEAASGFEAVRMAQETNRHFDLLLTDLVMPGGVNGKDLAMQLRQMRTNLKVVFISGYSLEVAGTDLELVEGVNYLAKPFVLPRLAEILRRQLDGIAANADQNASLSPARNPK